MKTQQQHISESSFQPAPAQMPAAAVNGKEALPLPDNRPGTVMQKKMVQGMQNKTTAAFPVQKKANNTGLPDQLKSGIENLSGMAMDDVKVHYGSPKPAQMQAHAYAQGSEIHVAPGQEKHLAHEAWHVVQQKQGRVRPTKQLKSKVNINDDKGLEQEADTMGAKAMQLHADATASATSTPEARPLTVNGNTPVMRKIGFEYEVGTIKAQKDTAWFGTDWKSFKKADVIKTCTGYNITADIDQNDASSNVEFVTDAVNENSPGAAGIITTMAQNIVADIDDIITATNGPHASNDAQSWVTLNHVPRINGKSSHRMRTSAAGIGQIFGQLQMTGGVEIHNLHKALSGSTLGRELTPGVLNHAPIATQVKQNTLSKYYATDQQGGAKQPIYHRSFAEINRRFSEDKWDLLSRRIIASVCALMAQTPIATRDASAFSVDSGMFLAKTDFATILQLAVDAVGMKIDTDKFLWALLTTINAFVPRESAVTADSDVFPIGFGSIPAEQQNLPEDQQRAVVLNGVTIGEWVRQAMPVKLPKQRMPFMGGGYDPMMEMDPGEEWHKGTDLLTPQNFPGTKAQKKEMHAFGTFGKKTDPGDKIIMEWRNFGLCGANDLEDAMLQLLDYNTNL